MVTEGTFQQEAFGEIDGEAIERYTLTNSHGLSVSILTYGGIVQSLMAPDRQGQTGNVVLGFGTLEDYVAKSPYFGAIVGRFANRIAGGTFELDGRTYRVPVNNGSNSLHGGLNGFDRRIWGARVDQDTEAVSVVLSRISEDGEEGYPGELAVKVTYSVDLASNALSVAYEAITSGPTVLNLSNHSYFNLSGEGSGDILKHVVQLRASHYLPIDETLIPTGEIAPVAGTPFDFTEAHIIGERIDTAGDDQLAIAGGYDHCWVADSGEAPGLAWLARVVDPVSGRILDVATDQPAVQFYSGNFLDGSFAGTSGKVYGHRSGFCLETQHFPDSPNQPSFPSTELRPGETFRSSTEFRFGALDR